MRLLAMLLLVLPSLVDAAEKPIATQAQWEAALANPSEGDELILAPGEYLTNVAIASYKGSFKVIGQPGVVLDLRGRGFTIQNTVEIHNCEITNRNYRPTSNETGSFPSDVERAGIFFQGPYCVLNNCHIHHLTDGPTMAGNIDLYGERVDIHGGTITNCEIHDIGWRAPDRDHGHGLYIQSKATEPSQWKRVANTIIYNVLGYDVHCYAAAGGLNGIAFDGVFCEGDFLLGGNTPITATANNVFCGGTINIGYGESVTGNNVQLTNTIRGAVRIRGSGDISDVNGRLLSEVASEVWTAGRFSLSIPARTPAFFVGEGYSFTAAGIAPDPTPDPDPVPDPTPDPEPPPGDDTQIIIARIVELMREIIELLERI